MSASREKKLRQDQTASGYVDPKAEKELEEKKAEKRSNVLYSVIAVLFVLVVAASFLWRSNVISRNATALTIDGETYNAAEVNFYYQNVYRGFLQSNSYFISYLGLDTNASLKSQTVNATAASMMGVEEGSSWHDYIMDNTVKQMTMVQRGLKQAQEEGYQFPASVQEQYEDSLNSLKTSAESTGMSVKAYLQRNLGAIMTEKVYNQQVLRMLQYQAYAQSYSDSLTYSAADLQAAYDEDPDAYCSVDIEYVSFTTGLSSDATDAEKSAAMEEAKAKAEAVLAAYAEGRSFEESAGDGTYTHLAHADRSVTSDMLTWAFAADRTEGDTTVAEQSSGYVAVLFHSRSRDDYHPVTVRHILVADEQTAADIYSQFNNTGDKTENEFATLAATKSTDSGTASNGGLVSNMRKGAYVQPFEDWSFDPSRQSGDTDIIKSEYGYHVMYFVETNPLPYWEYKATNTLKSSAVNDWYDAITDGVTAEQLDAIEYVG